MKDLTQGNEARLILSFSIPMLLGNVFQQLYNVIDSIIVGHYIGKEALVAVGTSFPIIFAMISFMIGLSIGSTIVVAQYYGARDFENVKKTVNTMYVFLFFASIVISILGIIFSEAVFRLIDLPEAAIPQAKLFLNVYFIGLIFLFGFNGTSAVLRGLGDSKTPLYFLIASTLMNIFLALLFVIVFKWGITGAALATVISEAVIFIGIIWYLNKYHSLLKFTWKELTFTPHIFSKIIRIGLPTGFQQTFVALGMMALYSIVNQFGLETNAAYSVAGRIDSFASLPAMSFAAALSTFVGQNLGANKPQRVRTGLRATLLMTSVLSLIISFFAVFFGGSMMSVFTPDEEVIAIGNDYLLIVGSFYSVFSAMFIVGAVMRGAGDTIIPMFITLFSLWVIRIPLAFFLSGLPGVGITGIWWAIPIAWVIGTILSYIYYKSGRWKKKVIIPQRAEIIEPEVSG